MKITILGGSGKMGGWLTNHFLNQHHTIVVSDPNKSGNEVYQDSQLEFTEDNVSAVSDADVVFISVPMDCTSKVIREVAPHMKRKSILCEISTTKTSVHAALRDINKEDIRILSIHPLFGHEKSSMKKRFALIPVEHLRKERAMFDTLFPESEVIVIDVEKHDRMMALTLSVPYFINSVLASIYKNEDIEMMERLSGTTFAIQFMLMGSILSHSSAFHTALLKENNFTIEVLKKLRSETDRALKLFMNDVESYDNWYQQTQSKLEKTISLTSKYKEMYRILETKSELSEQEVEG